MTVPAAGTGAPRTVAWFHCFAGIAGDMALGSLLDAGADEREVRKLLELLPLGGWDLRVEPVLRGGVAATRAVVTGRDDRVVRTHAHIVGLVHEARLPERVTRRSLAVFAALARAEAHLHRRAVEHVHFHEVGGHDAVVDIVGTAAALEVLGVDEVTASPVATGTGTVRSAHGLLPNPSPAVVRLLAGVPTYGRDTRIELTTPTGAALLAALATSFGPLPPLLVRSSGFGAGAGELADLPNCTQVVIGEAAPAGPAGIGPGQPVVTLEANLDDATGEVLALAVRALLEAGAHDAWVTPVVMKKGRPGHTVHALVDPADAARIGHVLRSATGTFGMRATTGERWPVARALDEVEVDGRVVRVKVGPDRVKAEFDDVARASAESGRPPHEISSRAEELFRRRAATEGPGDDPGPDAEPA